MSTAAEKLEELDTQAASSILPSDEAPEAEELQLNTAAQKLEHRLYAGVMPTTIWHQRHPGMLWTQKTTSMLLACAAPRLSGAAKLHAPPEVKTLCLKRKVE